MPTITIVKMANSQIGVIIPKAVKDIDVEFSDYSKT